MDSVGLLAIRNSRNEESNYKHKKKIKPFFFCVWCGHRKEVVMVRNLSILVRK